MLLLYVYFLSCLYLIASVIHLVVPYLILFSVFRKRLSFAEETPHGRQQVVVARVGRGGGVLELRLFLHICASLL